MARYYWIAFSIYQRSPDNKIGLGYIGASSSNEDKISKEET